MGLRCGRMTYDNSCIDCIFHASVLDITTDTWKDACFEVHNMGKIIKNPREEGADCHYFEDE